MCVTWQGEGIMSEAPVKITEAEAVGMRYDFEALVAWVLHFLGADAEDPVRYSLCLIVY